MPRVRVGDLCLPCVRDGDFPAPGPEAMLPTLPAQQLSRAALPWPGSQPLPPAHAPHLAQCGLLLGSKPWEHSRPLLGLPLALGSGHSAPGQAPVVPTAPPQAAPWGASLQGSAKGQVAPGVCGGCWVRGPGPHLDVPRWGPQLSHPSSLHVVTLSRALPTPGNAERLWPWGQSVWAAESGRAGWIMDVELPPAKHLVPAPGLRPPGEAETAAPQPRTET